MAVPCLIGVIPDCQDRKLWRFPARSDFWDVIRSLKADGWAIAQHGYTHVYDIVASDLIGIPRRSEFAGHDFEIQASRLSSGSKILADNGVPTDIFMAPCHAFDAVTIKALRRTGFRFVTDGAALWPYEEQGLIFVPQMFGHPRHFGVGLYTVCCHLDTIDEREFQRLLRFVEDNTHRIICFEDATKIRNNTTITHVSRRGLEVLTHARLSASMRRQGVEYL